MSADRAIWYEQRILHHARAFFLRNPCVSSVVLRGARPHTEVVVTRDAATGAHEHAWQIWDDEPYPGGLLESPVGFVGVMAANWGADDA